MAVIDKETIQMFLDVSGFTEAADEALDVIDELRKSLDFSGIADGLSKVGESTKNMGFQALQDGLFNIQNGFNELDLLALKVLDKINTKLVDIATNLGKAITIDPITTGLEEYETQINSVQTILANTSDKLKEDGLTTEHERIEKVNDVLDELNHYADMTIYNFTEMTRNIGTFTAAGVDLDTAATAIQGIANLAAMSGSNSQQASTAMYQLSQALASGTVKLQDWNSVVNAGMGGKLFQNELIETASAMHVADETLEELKNGTLTFRDSLQEGWLTSDVLINTLEKFTAGTEGYTKSQVESMQELWRARGYSEQQIKELTGTIHQLSEEEEANLRQKWIDKGFSQEQVDHILEMGAAATDAATKVKTFSQLIDTVKEALQSGWTQSWEYIAGDFEQAKRFWTEISDIMNLYIGKSADSRNAILETWSKAKYSYNEENQLIDAETGELIEGQQMLSSEMGGRELVIQGLRNSFQSLSEIVFQLKEAFRLNFWGNFSSEELAKMDTPLSNIMLSGEKLIELSRNFESATASFKDSLFSTDRLARLREVFDQVATSCRTLFDAISGIIPSIGNILDAFFHSSFFKIDVLDSIAKAFDYVVQGFAAFGDAFNKHFGPENAANREGLMNFFSAIQGYLESSAWTKLTYIKEAFMAVGAIFEHIIAPFGTVSEVLGILGDKISNLVKAFDQITHNADGTSKITTMFQNITNSVNSFIDSIGKTLDFSGISSIFETITNAITSDKVDLFGTFENVIVSITNVLQALASVAMPIITAFVNVFSPAIEKIGGFINEVTDRIRSLTESLIANEPVMKGIESLFTGIFNVIEAVGEVLGDVFLSVWDSLADVFSSFLPTGEKFGGILTNIGTDLTNFSQIILSLTTGDEGVPKLSDVIGLVTDKFKDLFTIIDNLDPLQKLHDLLDAIFKGLKHALGGTDDMSMFDIILEKVKSFIEGLKRVFSGDDGEADFDKVFTAGGIVAVIDRLIGFFKDFSQNVSGFSNIVSIFKTFMDGISEALEAVKNRMKVDTIKTIATSLLEIAGALFIIAMIDSASLAQATGVVVIIFKTIGHVLKTVAGFKPEDTVDLAAAGAAIFGMGTAILEISIAISMLGNMNFEDMVQGLMGVIILVQALVKVAEKLAEIGNEKELAGTGSLILLATALDMLIIPVKMFGEMQLEDLAKGMVATGIGLAGLVLAAQQLGKAKGFGVTDSVGLILMAESIKILSKSILLVKDLSWEELAKGLSVFAVGLIGMVGAASVISSAHLGDELMELGAALLMLGASMMMLSSGLTGIANLSWEDLGKGLAVFAAALVGLGIASYAINGTNLLAIGAAIFLIATAFTEFSLAINLGQLLAPICMSLANAFNAIRDSMVEFAQNAAFESFLSVLKNLITFLPEVVTALAQALIDFVVTLGNGAAQLVEAVTNLGGAILQGIIQLLPQVFEVFGTFLTELWTFLQEQTPQFFETLGVFFTELWTFLQEQIPQVFEVLGTFFTELFGFLTEQTPNFFEWINTVLSEFINFMQTHTTEIIEAVRIVLDTILQAIITEAPRIGETLTTLLDTVLNVVQEAIPTITETVLSLLSELLEQLEEYVPKMADSALKIINGFLKAIGDNLEEIVKSGIDIALAFIRGVTEKIDEIVDAGFKLIIGFIDGLAKAIDENHQALYNAIGHLITAIFNAIVDGVKTIADGAGKLISGFTKEFDGKKLMDDLADIGANLVQGIIDGIIDFGGDLFDEAGKLAGGVLDSIKSAFGIASPSKEGFKVSGYLVQGLTNGVNENAGEFIDATGEMAYGALDALSCLDTDAAFSPTVTPIIDAETFQNGIKMMNVDLEDHLKNDLNINMDNIISKQTELVENILEQMQLMEKSVAEVTHDGFSSMDESFNKMAAMISDMKLVLDTGTLVGEITPQIDQSLGDRQALTDRGVY